jgi:hypothetical protein
VIGAGPAGLQAARIAAERGHAVTLLGASECPGGKLNLEAQLPGGGEYGRLIAWMERQARAAGVKAELGLRASVDDVAALRPDKVILATGSHQRRPDGLTSEGVSARDWVGQGSAMGRRRAVLFDMDHTAMTYAVADALAQQGPLVLLTPRTQIARQVNYCSAIGIHRRLYEAGVEIVQAAEPVALRDGVLTWRNVFTSRMQDIDDVGLVVWSTPRIADDALALPLRAAGLDVQLVGDCMAPRNLICAIHEGEAAALAV